MTTRQRGLIKGADEVELGTLSRDEALSLLLAAGDVPAPAPGAPPPAAAVEAVEICGCLPLCVQVCNHHVNQHPVPTRCVSTVCRSPVP